MIKKEIPLVNKKGPVSIIAVGDSKEATALREALENFGYRVDMHWVGSRKEFLEILSGNIATNNTVILSVHGIEEGIYMPDEKAVSADDIAKIANLKDKTVINFGCITGKDNFVKSFIKNGKASVYIAPEDYPEGSAALLFGIVMFYELSRNKTIEEAVEKASSLDNETKIFKLFKK